MAKSQCSMRSAHDIGASIYTDEDVLVLEVLANDPRACPTEAIVIGGPASGYTLAELETVPGHLRDLCEWGVGYEEEIKKSGGGIGAEGATIVSLVLAVVGTVPTIVMLFELLHRPTPPLAEHDDALGTATWAVALQYPSVVRNQLDVVREVRESDHWTFFLRLASSRDEFEVDVFGSRSKTVATRVVWTNGEAWGRQPGEASD